MDMISAALATGLIRAHYAGDALAQHEALKTEQELDLEAAVARGPQEDAFAPLSRAARKWLSKLEALPEALAGTNKAGGRHA
ncbi:hypothetical protein [Chitinimonas naiadis]